MSIQIGVPKETYGGERRVALAPSSVAPLKKAGVDIVVESGAGNAAGYPDELYVAAGATIVSRAEALSSPIVAVVRYLGADPDGSEAWAASMKKDQIWIGHADPLWRPDLVQAAAKSGALLFSMELVPRITRAQAMDALSSQANLAGYKGVLLGASEVDRILPMMTTAAGTIPPAKVLILGAGVAGLQAVATAKRLGAVVSGYDVRPEVKTQIESLGARFVELDLQAEQGEGGYAKEQGADFYRRQQELLGDVMAEMDLVVTTALVPGRKAPILITTPMVAKMKPGSVVVDLAAERGGNCELTSPGETVDSNGVKILGPLNIPSSVAHHASALYGKNIASFVNNIVTKGELTLDKEDPIVAESLLTADGEVVNARVKGALNV